MQNEQGDSGAGTPVVPMAGLIEGRHVFYEDVDGTHAAIVSKVWDGVKGYVNLCVLQFDGTTYSRTSVYPEAGIGGPPSPATTTDEPWTRGRWRWMFSSQPTALTGDSGKYNK